MMNLGNKIRELRKKKGLTQEQLATALNLSPQAVSKWESEASYPDITMIPVLANFFDVTLDTLFDFDLAKKQKRIEEIINEAGRYFWSDMEKAEEIFKQGIKEYPSSDKIKAELLSLYESHMRSNGRMELADRAIVLAGQIIGESGDIFAVCSAKDSLSSIYLMRDQYDEAKKVIDSLPYMWPYMLNDKMRCASYHLKGQDRLAGAKDWKVIETQELFIACDMEGQGYFEIGDYESALKSFSECRDVIERFLLKEDLCSDAYPIQGTQSFHWGCYLEIAGCYLKLGKTEECGKAIDRAYYVLSHGWDSFAEDPESFMKSYRETYKEFGLEAYKPCL